MSNVGWTTVPLGNVADINMGQSPPSSTVNEDGLGMPFIQGNAEFGPRSPQPVKYCSKPQKEARLGDLLLSVRAPVGALNLADQPLCIGRGLSAITATGVESAFLWHALRREVLGLTRVAQGSTFSAVNKADLRTLEIPLPPVGEQRKIAAILSSVEDAIEKTQAVIDQMQVVKRGLMQELLTRGLPGRHTRFKQTEIGEFPDEWQVLTIQTLCNVVRGSTPRPARDPRYFNGDHVPWITVSEVTKDEWPFLFSTRTGLTEEGARFSRYLKPGTVILTNSGVTLGVPKILKLGGCANDGIAAFQDVSASLGSLFLYYVLSAMTDEFKTRVARGVGQPNLNTSLIGSTPIPVPSRLEQDEIAEVILCADQRIAAESAYGKELQTLKSSLMSVLLTGELRVTLETKTA